MQTSITSTSKRLCLSLSLCVLQAESTSHTSGGRGGGNIEREQPWSRIRAAGRFFWEVEAGSSDKTGECDMIDSEDAVWKLPGESICARARTVREARLSGLQGCLHLEATGVCTACRCEALFNGRHNLFASTDSVSIQSSLPGPPSGTQANAAASIGPNGTGPLWTAFVRSLDFFPLR